MNFMSYVAEVSRGWDEPNARDMGRMMSQPNAKGEMYILNDSIDMKVKITAMAGRLEELEMKKMQEVQAISQTLMRLMDSYALALMQIGNLRIGSLRWGCNYGDACFPNCYKDKKGNYITKYKGKYLKWSRQRQSKIRNTHGLCECYANVMRISHNTLWNAKFSHNLEQLASEGHIFLISAPNRAWFEALDSSLLEI
ncbi:hypothetical protein CK203_097609 [Vitis vinifera]|uniref:Uncharacterized protein n=1 Tax=Vitis vinifera TaxID=29760 RepID=A0A438CKM7_VITVI|nr:hypothetical protein CK203_097609 [Vitis vinifera]